MDQPFTHFTSDGRPVMVDVTEKAVTKRVAVAEATVHMDVSTRDAIVQHAIKKGDVLSIAQLAGIMATKKTSELIPLCHPVPLHHVSFELGFDEQLAEDGHAVLRIRGEVDTVYQTGVEMEALTGCSVAALTVYDMCKALDRGMTIQSVRLLLKNGGNSGLFQAIST